MSGWLSSKCGGAEDVPVAGVKRPFGDDICKRRGRLRKGTGLSEESDDEGGGSSEPKKRRVASTSEEEEPVVGEQDYLEFRAVTERVRSTLVDELAGDDPQARAEIEAAITRGRCSFTRSARPPPRIKEDNPNLKEYQIAAVHWLLTLFKHGLNGLVADDMGLGKSAECICFLKRLYADELLTLPAVVACPATLLDNWCDEFNKWAPKIRVLKYHGSQTERKKLMRKFETGLESEDEDSEEDEEETMEEKQVNPDKDDNATEDEENSSATGEDDSYPLRSNVAYHVLITTHQTLASQFDRQLFFKQHDFGYLVVDEAHSLKNSASHRYQQMNRNVNAPNRLLMTGSPVQNQIGELKNLLTFLNPYRKSSFDMNNALIYHTRVWKQALDRNNKADGGRITELASEMRAGIKSEVKHKKEVLHHAVMDIALEKTPQGHEEGGGAPDLVTKLPGLGLEALKETPEEEPDTTTPNVEPSCADSEETSAQASPPQVEAAQQPESSSKESTGKKSEEDGSSSAVSPSAVKGSNKTDPEILFYQQLLAPLILRRLKAEVISNFPRKTNKIELCNMLPGQQALYDEEIRNAKPLLANVTPSGRKRRPAKKLDTGLKPNEPTPSAFIKGLLFRLRRICNHTLLHQKYFKPSERLEFATYLRTHVSEFKQFPIDRVQQHMQDWSDFDLHVEANNHLPALQHFRIPAEEFLESCKIRRMLELIDELCVKKDEKILIFSQFTTFLDVIQEALHLHRPSLGLLRLDGSTAVEERSSMVSAFQMPGSDYRIFLLSTKAGGVGLNLTKAATVLLMDQDWNPHNDRQAEDRVHRLGQTEDVTVYRLCCRHSFEETVLSCCKKKLELDEAFGGTAEALPLEIFEDIIRTVKVAPAAAEGEGNTSSNSASEKGAVRPPAKRTSSTATKRGDDPPDIRAPRKRPTPRKKEAGETPVEKGSSRKRAVPKRPAASEAKSTPLKKVTPQAAKGKVRAEKKSEQLLPGCESEDESRKENDASTSAAS